MRATLLALAIALLAPAAAVAQAPDHVVASANGQTARSSADEGEIVSCNTSGCTSAITAPARPPEDWDGEVPVTGRTVIELRFSRPVELLGAEVANRSLQRISVANVERIDDQHFRVTLSADAPPDEAALELHERWEGDDSRGHYTVTRTDFIGLQAPARIIGAKQRARGGGTVADVQMRTSGLVDARLALGKKTLGRKSTNLSAPRKLRLSVPLSRGARRTLADRRTMKATLAVTVRPPSGDALTIERRVTLRAKPR